jgi:hypothetical protein
MKKISTVLLLAVACLTLTGCAFTDKLLTHEAVIQHLAETNAVTGAVIPAFAETNFVANPVITGAATVVSALPFPFAGVAGVLLGALPCMYAAFRNRKALVAVIQGIEAGRQVLQSTVEGKKLDAVVRGELIKHQDAAGVLKTVSNLVSDYTGNTTQPATG